MKKKSRKKIEQRFSKLRKNKTSKLRKKNRGNKIKKRIKKFKKRRKIKPKKRIRIPKKIKRRKITKKEKFKKQRKPLIKLSFQKVINFVLHPFFRAYDDFREKRKIEKLRKIDLEKKEKER